MKQATPQCGKPCPMAYGTVPCARYPHHPGDCSPKPRTQAEVDREAIEQCKRLLDESRDEMRCLRDRMAVLEKAVSHFTDAVKRPR